MNGIWMPKYPSSFWDEIGMHNRRLGRTETYQKRILSSNTPSALCQQAMHWDRNQSKHDKMLSLLSNNGAPLRRQRRQCDCRQRQKGSELVAGWQLLASLAEERPVQALIRTSSPHTTVPANSKIQIGSQIFVLPLLISQSLWPASHRLVRCIPWNTHYFITNCFEIQFPLTFDNVTATCLAPEFLEPRNPEVLASPIDFLAVEYYNSLPTFSKLARPLEIGDFVVLQPVCAVLSATQRFCLRLFSRLSFLSRSITFLHSKWILSSILLKLKAS